MELPLPQLPLSLLSFESSYLLLIHSWDSTIYNRHLSHHPVPFALTITQVQHLRMLMTDKSWSTHQLPQATLTTAFIYLSHCEVQREKVKKCRQFPHIFSPFVMFQCKVVLLQVKKQPPKLSRDSVHFPPLLQYSSPISFPWRQWDFKQRAGLDIVTYQWNTEIWTKSHIHMEKKNHISRLRTITGNKSHRPLIQTSLVFPLLDSTSCATQQTSKQKC